MSPATYSFLKFAGMGRKLHQNESQKFTKKIKKKKSKLQISTCYGWKSNWRVPRCVLVKTGAEAWAKINGGDVNARSKMEKKCRYCIHWSSSANELRYLTEYLSLKVKGPSPSPRYPRKIVSFWLVESPPQKKCCSHKKKEKKIWNASRFSWWVIWHRGNSLPRKRS